MMRTARRLAKDEAGVTMALAVIMIVLLGVMGAGLLTFVTRDLNTVIEENRGQRAFEMADAGIQAGKRQLISDCVGAQSATCSALYGGAGTSPWSAAQGGLNLGNLDGVGSTDDSVHVEISEPSTNRFVVVSTGTYGVDSTRRIEAKFEASAGGGGGGGNITFPSAWTESSILIKGPGAKNVRFNKSSLFSAKNIIFEGITKQIPPCTTSGNGGNLEKACYNPWTNFQGDYNTQGGTFDVNGAPDKAGLLDWDSRNLTPPGYWNVVGRKDVDNNGDLTQNQFEGTGFAAEGLVCGTTTATPPYVPDCDADDDSIADGHYAYDRTTDDASRMAWVWDKKTQTGSYSKAYGQGVRFEQKPEPTNVLSQDPHIISYPFPTDPKPDPARLKEAALGSGTYYKAQDDHRFYKPADPGTLYTWNQLVSNANGTKVIFIDAQGHDLLYDPALGYGPNNADGVIATWCGNLTMRNANFQGIVLAMKGDGATLGNDGPAPAGSGGPSTTCDDPVLDDNKGVLRIDHSFLHAWLYSNNLSDTTPGIQLGEDTELFFMPNGSFNLLDLILQDPVVTSLTSKGWRELYCQAGTPSCG